MKVNLNPNQIIANYQKVQQKLLMAAETEHKELNLLNRSYSMRILLSMGIVPNENTVETIENTILKYNRNLRTMSSNILANFKEHPQFNQASIEDIEVSLLLNKTYMTHRFLAQEKETNPKTHQSAIFALQIHPLVSWLETAEHSTLEQFYQKIRLEPYYETLKAYSIPAFQKNIFNHTDRIDLEERIKAALEHKTPVYKTKHIL